MPTRERLAVHRPPARRSRDAWAPLGTLAALWLATLAGACGCLVLHAMEPAGSERILVPAGMALLASALLQARLAVTGWRNGRLVGADNPARRLGFWSAAFAGAAVAFLVTLALGPARYVGCAWMAAVSLWQTVLLLPLAVSPRVLESWRKWSQARGVRRAGAGVCAATLLLVCGEAALRAQRSLLEGDWLCRGDVVDIAEAPGQPETPAAPLDDLDLRFAELGGGRFRVAMVGDRAALASGEAGGYLARVERIVPGVEIVPLEISHPWSVQSPGDLSERLAAMRPDVVLAVVAACDAVAHDRPAASWFDWRQWELARRLGRDSQALEDVVPRADASSGGQDFEGFLGALAPQVAACRTPIDEVMRARWQRTFSSLDDVRVSCRKERLPLGLVLVPGPFQLNRALQEALARRLNYSAQQFDVDLPQRRLAGFAESRKLPLLDLLPHLRIHAQPLYRPGGADWNERGSAAAATAIGGWLESCYGGQLALAAQLSSAP